MIYAIIDFRLGNYLLMLFLFIASSFLLGWGFSIVRGQHMKRVVSGCICIAFGLLGFIGAEIMHFTYNHIAW